MSIRLPRLSVPLCALSALLALAPWSAANVAKPTSGAVFMANPGDTETVIISGTQGCKFMVDAMSSDDKVATVSFSPSAGKKQKVTITAVGPGSATIQIMTSQGTIPACTGFMFDYTMVVEPDPTAFFKQAKGKLKDALKEVKQTANLINKDYCDALAAIAKEVKSGELSVDDALSAALLPIQLFSVYYHVDLDEFLDVTYLDLWNRSLEAGFTGITPDMIGLMPGGCGDWDKFADQVDQVGTKALSIWRKKLKQFQKALDKAAKGDDAELLMIISDPTILLSVDKPVPLPAPMPPMLPPPPPKVVEKNWTSSGRLSTSPTSRLEIGGSADPAAGVVTVKINGPNGFTATMMIMPGVDCGWMVEFPGLPTGSYTVEMSQNGDKPTQFSTTVV